MSCVDSCNDFSKIPGGTRFNSSIYDFLMFGTDKSRRIWSIGNNFLFWRRTHACTSAIRDNQARPGVNPISTSAVSTNRGCWDPYGIDPPNGSASLAIRRPRSRARICFVMMLNRCCESGVTWDDLVVEIWRFVELAEARAAILRQAGTRFAGIPRRRARCEARICFTLMLYVLSPSSVAREGLEAEILACVEPAATIAAGQSIPEQACVLQHVAKINL